MIESFYHGSITIGMWEYFLLPLFLLVIFFVAARIKRKRIVRNPHYKYFMWGLYAKIVGAFGFCMIYFYLYKGGDMIHYFECSYTFFKLAINDPAGYLEVLFSPATEEARSIFTADTGYPFAYMYFDNQTSHVVKFTSVFVVLGFGSILLSTMLLAAFSYLGVWKLYSLLVHYFPNLSRQLAFGILLVPSVVFWGSGILKDTFTFAGLCLFVVSFHDLFIIRRGGILTNIIILLISSYVLINVKPYIFMVAFPSVILWNVREKVGGISNLVIRNTLFPFVLIVSVASIIFFFKSLEGELGKFSLENALNTAVITSEDMKNSANYGENYFDIGTFDGSLKGALKMFFPATNAGLFRPYIWHSTNVVMLFSGLENLALLLVTIFIVFKIGLKRVFRYLKKDPILTFCFTFSILFAFIIGITTTNYGALVRFKIPLIPFYLSFLLICLSYYKAEKIEAKLKW